MRDELSGEFGELDTMGKDRMLANAMLILRLFGAASQQYRNAIQEAGGVVQLSAVLQYSRSKVQEEHGFFELQHNLVAEACTTLYAISVGQALSHGCKR